MQSDPRLNSIWLSQRWAANIAQWDPSRSDCRSISRNYHVLNWLPMQWLVSLPAPEFSQEAALQQIDPLDWVRELIVVD